MTRRIDKDLGARFPKPQAHRAIDFWERNLLEPFYVYAIREHDGGPVKIGKARDPRERLNELQCGNPRALTLQAAILAQPATETRLHRAYRFCRVTGEWFGGGYEEVICELMRAAGQRQIEWYAEGNSTEHVIDMAEAMIKNPGTVEAAA